MRTLKYNVAVSLDGFIARPDDSYDAFLQEGDFAVSDKVVNPVYHGRERAAGAGDPTNPLGQRWIGLGSSMGIHGTDRAENIGRNDLAGSISLSPHDAEDVFDILSVGSRVMIRR